VANQTNFKSFLALVSLSEEANLVSEFSRTPGNQPELKLHVRQIASGWDGDVESVHAAQTDLQSHDADGRRSPIVAFYIRQDVLLNLLEI